jgi:DNA-binding transcriptional regulator YdaS (Cro superfamily)
MNTVQLAVRRACDDPKVKTQANLARLLSAAVGRRVSSVRVQQWLSGKRPVPPHLCPAIEALTEQRVRCWELCPDDWHLIWPALVGTPGAPAVPVAANDAQALEAA